MLAKLFMLVYSLVMNLSLRNSILVNKLSENLFNLRDMDLNVHALYLMAE